ncbi:MAG TPA: HupE/UreJ family protein [Kofleriaceae bacterium]|nr:HupE/UreJ family protein [Kofleriaceae bacterium]
MIGGGPHGMRRPAALLIAVAGALAAPPASAHPLDLGYLRIDGAADGAALTATLDLDAGAAAHLLDTGALALDGPTLRARAAELADATIRRAELTGDGGACRWTAVSAELRGWTASLTVAASCPSGSRTLRWPMPFTGDPRVAPTFQLLVKARLGGAELVTTVDRAAPELVLGAGHQLGLAAMVWSGIEHIGAAPGQWHDADGWRLPGGLDHILFLLALLLAGGTLLQLAGIASGFTLGHSVTLALSGLGLVRPPASVIEPVIALSIALVAAQAFLGLRERRRWLVAAAFGLVHGFGFAGALGELELSASGMVTALLGYNAGVELGQLAIVLAIAPLILLLQRRPRAHHAVVRALSAAIFVAGMYWFVERLAG